MPTNHLPGEPEEPEADMLEVRESETKVSDSEVRESVPDSEVADAKVLGAEAPPQDARYEEAGFCHIEWHIETYQILRH